MLEKTIERALVRDVKNIGGWCLKLNSPSMDGLPDRLVLLPKGRCGFVELKAPGKKPRPLQVMRMKKLTELGFSCHVIDGKEQIGGVIDGIQTA